MLNTSIQDQLDGKEEILLSHSLKLSDKFLSPLHFAGNFTSQVIHWMVRQMGSDDESGGFFFVSLMETEKPFCPSSSFQVLPLYAIAPRDSYAWIRTTDHRIDEQESCHRAILTPESEWGIEPVTSCILGTCSTHYTNPV